MPGVLDADDDTLEGSKIMDRRGFLTGLIGAVSRQQFAHDEILIDVIEVTKFGDPFRTYIPVYRSLESIALAAQVPTRMLRGPIKKGGRETVSPSTPLSSS